MSSSFIDISSIEGHCLLTLNRPAKRNALNRKMRNELLDFFHEESSEHEIIILTGAGSAFCAGMDIREKELEGGPEEFIELVQFIYESSSIFIAAVNGAARGGGLMIINACDLAVGVQSMTVGMPDLSPSGDPAFQSPSLLKSISQKVDSYSSLMGGSISAPEALDLGVINRISTEGSHLSDSAQLADQIRQKGIEMVRAKKRKNNIAPFDNRMRSKKHKFKGF